MPEDVYKYVTRKDLSDIRVFNQNHEPVPHIIRQAKTKIVTESSSIELPYFPLPDNAENQDDGLDITVSSEGKVIRIQSEGGISDVDQGEIKYYLIDASHIDMPLESIDFQLTSNESGYAKTIRLEYSHDLNEWLTLVKRATLTELEYGNYTLKNTRVDLPHKNLRYLRFTWLDDANGLSIESVKANFGDKSLSEKRYWSTTKLINKNDEEAIYEFDTGGVFNIEQINLELPEDNTLIDVIIESRSDKDSDWKRQFRGIFYKLYLQETELTGKPVTVRTTKDRYWQIKLQSTDGIGQIPPVLKYAWRSNDLYFLAIGQAPYILAYGNANTTGRNHSSSKLMNIINQDTNGEMVGKVEVGQEIILKGDTALIKHKKIPWQRILLWAVLIIGVIVIATMVIRLIHKMCNY